MKTQVYLFLILYTFFASSLKGQPTTQHKIEKIKVDENVFLHLERSQYLAGESIDLKAYFVQGFGNQQSNLFKTIYIELLDPSSEQLKLIKFKIEKGFSRSSLKIEESWLSGTYFLRAYTNPIRSREKDFFLTKKITILQGPDQLMPFRDY